MKTSQIKLFVPFNPDVQRGQLKACELCGTKFGVFLPEHQCKRCLRAVCSGCTGAKRDVYKAKMQKSPHRICKNCNTESTILSQYIEANSLRFGIDSQLARKWFNKIPKISNQLTSFKQYRKFSVDTFSQLWDSYNFSLREFVGLLTYQSNQSDVYMLVNNVYTQLQSRGVDEKLENVIMMIVFMLCYSGPDLCTDLVQYLCNLKKTAIDQKSLLQVYLKTLSVSQTQQKKLSDLISYKFKQYIGPFSINSVTTQCSIHVISRAFQKQRIDELYMLLAVVLQNNWTTLLAEKGKGKGYDWGNFVILRDCNMGVYIGKFKVLGAVGVGQYTNPKLLLSASTKGSEPDKETEKKQEDKFIDKEKFIQGRQSRQYENLFTMFTSGVKNPNIDRASITKQPQINIQRQLNGTPPKPDYSTRITLQNRQTLQGQLNFNFSGALEPPSPTKPQKQPKYILKQEQHKSEQSLDESEIRAFELKQKDKDLRIGKKETNIVTGFRESMTSVSSINSGGMDRSFSNNNISVDMEELNFNKSQSENSIMYNDNFSYNSNNGNSAKKNDKNSSKDNINISITKQLNTTSIPNAARQSPSVNMSRKQSLLTLKIQPPAQSQPTPKSTSTYQLQQQKTNITTPFQMPSNPECTTCPAKTQQIQQLQSKLNAKTEQLERSTRAVKNYQMEVQVIKEELTGLHKKHEEEYRVQLREQEIREAKIREQYKQDKLKLQAQYAQKLQNQKLQLQAQQLQSQKSSQTAQYQQILQQLQQQLQTSQSSQKTLQTDIQSLQSQLKAQKQKNTKLTLSLTEAQATANQLSKQATINSNNQANSAKLAKLNEQLAALTKKNQQQEQKISNLNMDMMRQQKESIGLRNQVEELRVGNRLYKEKLEEANMGFGASKTNQNQEELTKMNQLMKKTIENKNKQLQNLLKKNKQLTLQVQQLSSKSPNILPIPTPTTTISKSQPPRKLSNSSPAPTLTESQRLKKLQKQNEQLMQKLKELGDKILKQQEEKLQLSTELFDVKVEVKERERAMSMSLGSGDGLGLMDGKRNSVVVGVGDRGSVVVEEKPRGHQCAIF